MRAQDAAQRRPARREEAAVRGHEDWCRSDVESRAVRVARKLESLPRMGGIAVDWRNH
jgi:hypothetical protein